VIDTNATFIVAMSIIAAPWMASFGMLLGDRWSPNMPLARYLKSTANEKSICDFCREPINPLALTAILGWIVHRGRCQCGLQKVSWTYPAGETLALAIMCGATWVYGPSAWPLTLIIAGMASAIRSDIAHCEIHEVAAILTAVGSLTFWWLNDGSAETLVTAGAMIVLCVGIYEVYRRRGRIDAIPLGDIMILAALSPLFTFDRGLLFFVALPFGAILTKKWLKSGAEVFPFAPAIGLSAAISLIPVNGLSMQIDRIIALFI